MAFSSVVQLSEWSVLNNSNSVKIPDFTAGAWKTNEPNMDINLDNLLAGFSTSSVGVTGPMFTLTDVNVDGLGRLTDANETITKTDGNSVSHLLRYEYDMLSQLTDANISNIDGNNWMAQYVYKKNGDMTSRTIQSSAESFSYDGHRMTDANGVTLSWDENGNLTTGVSTNLVWNWDNKLRSADSDGNEIALKYDPSGSRIYKDSGGTGRKYIVDIVGDLPVILLEIDTSDSSIAKTYIYANSQVLAQHDGSYSADRYFYLHDRLGSARQLIDTSGAVVNYYTFEPFGKLFATETTENVSNSFKFTGQYRDSETDLDYMRARMYSPTIYRFISRDPVLGQFREPLTLHKYLYCGNEPVNRIDPRGEWAVYITATGMASFGQSVVGQFGFGWDDEGNFEDIAIGGWGGGTPSVSGGISVGWAPFADTIYDLEGIGGAAGGSVKGFGVEAFVGDKIGMGIEVTISTAVLMDYIPAEMHGHATVTKVGFVSKAISSYIFEEGIYNAKTWGEGTAMLNLGAILGQ